MPMLVRPPRATRRRFGTFPGFVKGRRRFLLVGARVLAHPTEKTEKAMLRWRAIGGRSHGMDRSRQLPLLAQLRISLGQTKNTGVQHRTAQEFEMQHRSRPVERLAPRP